MLVVEDDIRYYSLFLPVIYTEIISQSRRLLERRSERRSQAGAHAGPSQDPAVLELRRGGSSKSLRYRDYLLGVVSDVEFPQGGELTPEAGFELARMVRGIVPDVPIVLQSSRTEFMERAHAEDFAFLQKRSPTLLGDLRRILVEQVGFGDFIFHLPDRQDRGRPRRRPECAGDPAAYGSGGKPRLPRRAQPLLALADGAHRIRPGAEAAAAQGH